MQKKTTLTRRVLARVLAEDLHQVHGGGYPPVVIPGPKDPTVSEAATSEDVPDHEPPLD